MPSTHGIRATYARGVCRKGREDGCPGHPETGISCREAWREARRPKVAERRARLYAEETPKERKARLKAEYEKTRERLKRKRGPGWVDGRTKEGRALKEKRAEDPDRPGVARPTG